MRSITVAFIIISCALWGHTAEAYPQSAGQDQSQGPCGPPPSGPPPSGPPPSGMPPRHDGGGRCGPPPNGFRPTGSPPEVTTT